MNCRIQLGYWNLRKRSKDQSIWIKTIDIPIFLMISQRICETTQEIQSEWWLLSDILFTIRRALFWILISLDPLDKKKRMPLYILSYDTSKKFCSCERYPIRVDVLESGIVSIVILSFSDEEFEYVCWAGYKRDLKLYDKLLTFTFLQTNTS